MINEAYRTKCKCGTLHEYATNNALPFAHGDEHDQINLVLGENAKIPLLFCFFCGGNDMGPHAEGVDGCKCQTLPCWAEDLAFPIEYNARFEEYYLIVADTKISFYYCPICGGSLPKSKRDENLFLEPSPEEVEAFHKKTVGIKTLSELIKTLGNPDEVFGEIKADSTLKKLYGQRDVMQAVRYDSLFNTVFLLAQEYEDGELVISIVRKPKT